jgi:D-alanine-D-alanine ligase
MDKDLMKRLFWAHDLFTVPSHNCYRSRLEHPRILIRDLEKELRYPMFVKPANMGSSVGISKVHKRAELLPAIRLALKYDVKFIVEQGASRSGVKAREFEVGVLANHPGRRDVSVVGEIIPGKEFYNYEDKYLAEGAVAVVPAKIPRKLESAIRDYAILAFSACELSGLARVDFLFDPESQGLYINEVNTMPGFTKISMYPKLWQATGMTYPALITRLIELALERARERAGISFSRD